MHDVLLARWMDWIRSDGMQLGEYSRYKYKYKYVLFMRGVWGWFRLLNFSGDSSREFISNFAFSFHAAWRCLNLWGLALFSSAILMLISYFARSFDGAMTQYMYILGISFGARIHYFCFGHKATKKETFSKGFQLAAVCDLAIHLGCFFCFTRWFRLSHRHVFNKLFVLSHLRNNYKRFELKCLRRANKTPT